MRADRYFDPVQIAQAGAAMLGLEGAVATGAGAVLLWGWLHDPLGRVEAISCEFGGQSQPMEVLDRLHRPDVLEILSAAPGAQSSQVGFLGLVQAEPELVRASGGRVSVTISTAHDQATSTNRLLFEPWTAFDESVGKRLPVSRMRPKAIARAAEAIRGPESARALELALAQTERQAFGSQAELQLSLVVPLMGPAAALRETLAYLDMSPHGASVEVVIVAASDVDGAAVQNAVLDAATSLRIMVVRTGRKLTAGAAARVGLQAATADMVVLMSDSIVPPASNWIAPLTAELETARFAAPSGLPRFDGLMHRFEAPRLDPSAADWGHEEVRSRLRVAADRLGLGRRSPGLVAGRRDALLNVAAIWSEFSSEDAFWAALLREAVVGGAGEFPTAELFTLAPGGAPGAESPDALLLDTYALAARWERSGSEQPAFQVAAE